jgi:2'-5' RNA ligase
MKYYLGGIVSDFQPFYNSLQLEIAVKFGLEKLLKKQRLPHITFKAPFERESIDDIKQFLDEFTQKHEITSLSIQGVSYFEKDVIFLDIPSSEQIKELHASFLEGLRPFSGISFEPFDKPDKHYHITIVKGEEMNSKFEEIFAYLSSSDISFDTTFDNLTLFSKNGKKTEIEQTYFLTEPKYPDRFNF